MATLTVDSRKAPLSLAVRSNDLEISASNNTKSLSGKIFHLEEQEYVSTFTIKAFQDESSPFVCKLTKSNCMKPLSNWIQRKIDEALERVVNKINRFVSSGSVRLDPFPSFHSLFAFESLFFSAIEDLERERR